MNWGSNSLLRAYQKSERITHLIGIGDVKGIPAGEIVASMTRYFNYGYTAKIVEVVRRGNWVHLTVVEDGSGYVGHSRLRADTIVAAGWPKDETA